MLRFKKKGYETHKPKPKPETKTSILDRKIYTFLTVYIVGLYYEILNKYYPRERNFRSNFLLDFKLRFLISKSLKPINQTFFVFWVFFFYVCSINFNKQSIFCYTVLPYIEIHYIRLTEAISKILKCWIWCYHTFILFLKTEKVENWTDTNVHTLLECINQTASTIKHSTAYERSSLAHKSTGTLSYVVYWFDCVGV